MNFAVDVICPNPSACMLAHLRYEDDDGNVDESICGTLGVHIMHDGATHATLFFVDESPLLGDLAGETIEKLNRVVKRITSRYVHEWSIYTGSISIHPGQTTQQSLPESVMIVRDAWSTHSMRISLMESTPKGLQDKQLGVFDVFFSDQNAPIITGIVLDARVSAEHIRSKLCSFVLNNLGKPGLNESAMLAWHYFGCPWGSASTRSE